MVKEIEPRLDGVSTCRLGRSAIQGGSPDLSGPLDQGRDGPATLPNPQSAIHNPQSILPILVKVAPDLSFSALDEILELAVPRQVAGIVATNTTITRPETSDPKSKRAYEAKGGLSGRPLCARSTEIVRHLYRQTRGALPLIGVGGIFNDADAWEKITAGASLVQIYTGLIYEGPAINRQIVRGLLRRLRESGFTNLAQAVGSAAKT